MTEGAREKPRGGTRSALLEAAVGLLEEGGIEAVTLRAVGERAGVSRQAPYRHFANKRELLSVVATGYFGRLGGRMGEAAETVEDPMERLEAISEAYVRFALENPSRYRMMFGLGERGGVHREMHEASRALHRRIVGTVVEAQEAGQLPAGDPDEMAALLYATGHGAIDFALSGHAEWEGSTSDPMELVRLLLSRVRRD